MKEEALANGAFAFIPKPCDLAEVDNCVVLALESRKGQSNHETDATQRAAWETLKKRETASG
jgi:FixJ family two-component response regulator